MLSICLLSIPLLILVRLARNSYKKYMDSQVLKPLRFFERRQFELIKNGDFSRFKSYIDHTPFNPALRHPVADRTMLMMCAPDDSKLPFAKHLLQKGCDINAADKSGITMLFLVSYSNCKELFNFAINVKNVDLNKSNSALGYEMNPLSACIYRNKYQETLQLLKFGANPTLCKEILQKAPEFYEANAVHNKTEVEKYKKLLDTYEKWYNGQRVLLLDYYLSQRNLTKNTDFVKKSFTLDKLPLTVIKTIAREFF